MKNGLRATALLSFLLILRSMAGAQAMPTATQPLQLSAFGAATGTWTGLDGGKNLGVTAGLDVGWRPFFGIYPSVEIRGTYPFDGGHVDSQKNVLYGFRAERYYGRFHPYVNFLLGRDKVIYQNGGFANSTDTLLYIDSVSNVFSYGGGVDLTLTDDFALKVDAQYQRYGVPVTPTGHIYSTPVSVGIVYHLNFNHRLRYDSSGQVRGYRPPPPPPAAPVQQSSPAPGDAAEPNSPPAESPSAPPPTAEKSSPETPAPGSSSQPQQPQ